MEDGSVAKFVFELKWPDVNKEWLAIPANVVDFWSVILELRSEVNKVLEDARMGKLIGSSLEAKVYIHATDSATSSKLQEMCTAKNDIDALHRIFITSQVELLTSSSGENEIRASLPFTGQFINEKIGMIWIGVTRADGMKCERCWNYSPQVGLFVEHPSLCARCFNVIGLQPLPAAAIS